MTRGKAVAYEVRDADSERSSSVYWIMVALHVQLQLAGALWRP